MDKSPPRGEKDSVLTVEDDLSAKQAMEDLERSRDGLEESLRTKKRRPGKSRRRDGYIRKVSERRAEV